MACQLVLKGEKRHFSCRNLKIREPEENQSKTIQQIPKTKGKGKKGKQRKKGKKSNIYPTF